jgi:hypothetical protein
MTTSPETPKVETVMKEVLTYQKAIQKGERLLALTIADITNGPPQSRFQDIGELEERGWATLTLCIPEPNEAADLIQALSPNLKLFSSSVFTAGIVTLHDETVTVNNRTYPATNAHIQSVLEAETGVLLAECNTTPEAMLNPYKTLHPATFEAKLPKLRYWSDVAFLQWKTLASSARPRSLPELKTVVRYEILNADTRAISSAILASIRKQRQETAEPGVSYDSWFPKWPGVTFSIDSEEAKALCGTPNGSGVLWLLAQHKAGLGHKTVDEVCLYYGDGNGKGLREVPTLIFQIKDV